jgi:hypothetical protein
MKKANAARDPNVDHARNAAPNRNGANSALSNVAAIGPVTVAEIAVEIVAGPRAAAKAHAPADVRPS